MYSFDCNAVNSSAVFTSGSDCCCICETSLHKPSLGAPSMMNPSNASVGHPRHELIFQVRAMPIQHVTHPDGRSINPLDRESMSRHAVFFSAKLMLKQQRLVSIMHQHMT